MYEVIYTEQFRNDIYFYVKKRHFHNIENDIKPIIQELENGNLLGNEIPNLKINAKGHAYKVRAANTDTKGGKSNGYRLIYYAVKDDKEIYLLTIYYKKDDIRIPTNKELIDLVAEYCL